MPVRNSELAYSPPTLVERVTALEAEVQSLKVRVDALTQLCQNILQRLPPDNSPPTSPAG